MNFGRLYSHIMTTTTIKLQNVSVAPQIPSCPFVNYIPFLHPQLLETTDLFPKCHMNDIIEHIVLWVCLLSTHAAARYQ